MKNLLITLTCLLLSARASFAQHATFTSSGTIEYEKSSNMYALMKKAYSGGNLTTIYQQIIDQYQKTQPQFKVLKSTLVFGSNKTLFTPIVPDVPPTGFNSPISDQFSTVYTDLDTHTAVLQKTIADATFLVKDSVKKITWKITNEVRDIAGYPCRRANGLVLDSLYAVAFYTDKIAVSGGPESFSGLPGMILLLQIPNEHVTWTATKIIGMDVAPATLVPPKKGKVVNNKQFFDFLKSTYSNQAVVPGQIPLIMKAYLL